MWLEVYKASESAASVSVVRRLRNQQHTTANCTSWHPTYPGPGQEIPTTHIADPTTWTLKHYLETWKSQRKTLKIGAS